MKDELFTVGEGLSLAEGEPGGEVEGQFPVQLGVDGAGAKPLEAFGFQEQFELDQKPLNGVGLGLEPLQPSIQPLFEIGREMPDLLPLGVQLPGRCMHSVDVIAETARAGWPYGKAKLFKLVLQEGRVTGAVGQEEGAVLPFEESIKPHIRPAVPRIDEAAPIAEHNEAMARVPAQ